MIVLPFFLYSKPTKVKFNLVDGVRQRVSVETGNVIKKPLEAKQRSHPVTSEIGPKDTAPNDVCPYMSFFYYHIGYRGNI